MTDQLPRAVPAGWYEDPDDDARLRWWNGLGWTDNRAERPATTGRGDEAGRA